MASPFSSQPARLAAVRQLREASSTAPLRHHRGELASLCGVYMSCPRLTSDHDALGIDRIRARVIVATRRRYVFSALPPLYTHHTQYTSVQVSCLFLLFPLQFAFSLHIALEDRALHGADSRVSTAWLRRLLILSQKRSLALAWRRNPREFLRKLPLPSGLNGGTLYPCLEYN